MSAASTETNRTQGAQGLIDACKRSDAADDLLAALKLALPYVQNIAGTQPTEYNRMVRQRQACKDVAAIKAAIAKAEGGL